MKLVRFGEAGAEKPGIVDAQGKIRDLSAHIPDFTGQYLSPASLDAIRKIDLAPLPFAPDGERLGAPVAGTRTFIAIGLNYADHAKETGQEIPAEPILFNKAATCICGPFDDVMYPKNSDRMDWECEIAFVIGTRARYVEGVGGREVHRRLHHLQRRVGAPLPDEAQRPVGQGQVGRDVRSARSLSRDDRRDSRSA